MMLELYKNIRKYRIENNLTQEELAALTGYTDRSSIAKIERGDVDLPQSKILLFASALNVDAGTLMGDVQHDSVPLSSDAATLLEDYDKLNAEGKSEARKQVRNLTKIEDYTKDTESSASKLA